MESFAYSLAERASVQSQKKEIGMTMHICNPSARETGADGPLLIEIQATKKPCLTLKQNSNNKKQWMSWYLEMMKLKLCPPHVYLQVDTDCTYTCT